MHLHEIIFCATASPSTASGSGSVTLHDINTGASLASFKQTNAAPHCTTFLNSKNAQGGFFLAAQPDKSLLHAYNFQKDQISLKIVLPEKLTCVALDPSGDLFAGGTAQGRIYLWEISSGILFNSWDAHYRQINVLRFTPDGAALLSGSDDSGINVWSVSRLLDEESQNTLALPYFTLTDHTLPVTDIFCGMGSFPECRVLSSSIDHSVKLWDLSSRSLLTTFMFPEAISYLACEPTERLFFAASTSSEGAIYQMNLFRQPEDKGAIARAIGGGGVNDIIRITDAGSHNKRLITVGQPITCLSLSLTSNLIVGTSSGLIHIYDTPTHQLLRTISTHKGLSISYLATLLKPIDLTGHVSFNFNSSVTTVDTIPVKPVVPFQRMRDAKAREIHEVSMMLPPQRDNYEDESEFYSKESLLHDHAYFTAPSSSGIRPGDISVPHSRVSELEAEVVLLRGQLGQAKGVNDLMWETIVQKVVHTHTKSTSNVNSESTDERRTKRGRTESDLDVHS
ncbi:WD40-repeat-containing domain protein [Lentinula detonsa]|uniref:Pre-rRNA-processing protein IPI3 n=1 Tax=Lentinula detonsa TaxID=2804962 RepID=A0AA38Q8K9_9AGAR|nr:WD40-repeat-containing domain protein [Lentinula detonsa]